MKIVQLASFLLVLKVVASSRIPHNNDLGEILRDSEETNVEHAIPGDKRCMGVLGCFELSPDFYHPLYRPVNLLPHDRHTIATKFVLFTRAQPKEPYELWADDPERIESSPLDPTQRTVFVVHGFFDNRLIGKWMEALKDSLLARGTHNVIIVDWSKGNGAPYTQATANTRVVGAEIALIITKLQTFKGVDPMNCHIVGHSLGAHIAGYAGERLNRTLGRITALDPAGPYFQYMPTSVRLDTTDADFVDAIHTDGTSKKFLPLGMEQAIGHLDFYPNNGRDQPGCNPLLEPITSLFLDGIFEASRRFVSCYHQRAVDFFIDSLDYQRALPVAYECQSWDDYMDGRCAECSDREGARCAVIGMDAEKFKPHKDDSKSVQMYLATANKGPFWENVYQIKMKLKKPVGIDYTDKNGEIHLDVQGSENKYGLKLSSKGGNLVHGETYYFLIRKPYDYPLGDIRSVKFSWKPWYNIFQSFNLYLDYVKITPMSLEDEKSQKEATKMFCVDNGAPIESREVKTLVECHSEA